MRASVTAARKTDDWGLNLTSSKTESRLWREIGAALSFKSASNAATLMFAQFLARC
jgi:hypothetical protein